jgi:hypothetical protein
VHYIPGRFDIEVNTDNLAHTGSVLINFFPIYIGALVAPGDDPDCYLHETDTSSPLVRIIIDVEPNTLPSNFTTKWKEITHDYIEELNGEIPDILIPHIATALPRVTEQETTGLRADGTRYLTV